MDKLKVLVVDDTIVYRKVLSDAVEGTGLGHVEQTASNGLIALERLKQHTFDVVLLDVFMPEMDGLETLKTIKKHYPNIEVIICSGGGDDSAAITVKALQTGAIDFILKPSESTPEKNIEKIKNQLHVLFSQIKIKKYTSYPSGVKTTVEQKTSAVVEKDVAVTKELNTQPERKIKKLTRVDLVLIASSTGGPMALEAVCKKLPADFNKPILIVQHMPKDFTRIMAQSLDSKCMLNVVEAAEGDSIKPGLIMVAPGGIHMEVNPKTKTVTLTDSPPVNGVRPAADVLFASVAKAYNGQKILAIILTGMGNDGMNGVLKLKNACDCYCITQSEKTCVVYGMPRSVFAAALSDEVIDLENITDRIIQIVLGRG